MQPKLNTNNPDCNVYVANLPPTFDENRLYILCSPYGKIIRHKFVAGELKSQPGYGFVQFANRNQAQNAIKQLNNYTFPTGETIYISLALHRRSTLSEEATNLYVKKVPISWKNDMLHKVFSKYGTIRQCKIIGDGIAFVRYDDHNHALDAIDNLNGTQLGLQVEFATRKTAATSYQLHKISECTKSNSHNLYVRNLPVKYTQKQLEHLFKSYGRICAAKLSNKGIAFVRFVNAEDAINAINKLNGTKPQGFDAEIVVKLAHFDIGDCRNRMKSSQTKDECVTPMVAPVTAPVTIPSVQSIPNVNMLNVVNPFMLINGILNNVPMQSVQQNGLGFVYPFNVGKQMGYIIPSNMISIPNVASIPNLPSIPRVNVANNME